MFSDRVKWQNYKHGPLVRMFSGRIWCSVPSLKTKKNVKGTHELYPQHMHARLQTVGVYTKEIYAYNLFVYFFTIYIQDIRLPVWFPMLQKFLLFLGMDEGICVWAVVQLHWSHVALTRTPPGRGAHRSRWRRDNVRLPCCSRRQTSASSNTNLKMGGNKWPFLWALCEGRGPTWNEPRRCFVRVSCLHRSRSFRGMQASSGEQL